jgi:hypothetical protein
MDWPVEEFNAQRKKVTRLCFLAIFVPSFILYYFVVHVKHEKIGLLIIAMCALHIYVSLMYTFPKLFSRYTNLFMLALGEETMSGKGFENNRQKYIFILTQAIAAVSIFEISEWLLRMLIEQFPMLVKNQEIIPGIIYSLISTILITSFLWLGITRLRERGILREHWGGKRLFSMTDAA